MSKKEKILALLLWVMTALTEAHSFLLAFFPGLVILPNDQEVKIDVFLLLDYKVSVLWYLKMLFDTLLMLTAFRVISVLRGGYSKKMFLIFKINFWYHVFDFVSFLINFRKWHLVYWVVLAIMLVWTLKIIFSRESVLKVV